MKPLRLHYRDKGPGRLPSWLIPTWVKAINPVIRKITKNAIIVFINKFSGNSEYKTLDYKLLKIQQIVRKCI